MSRLPPRMQEDFERRAKLKASKSVDHFEEKSV